MSFIKSLGNVGLRAGWRYLKREGLYCPECGASVALPEKLPSEGVDFVVTCPNCGRAESIGQSILDSGLSEPDISPIEARDLDRKPARSSIRTRVQPDGTRQWLIPKRGKSQIGFFAYIWCGFIAVFSFFWGGGILKAAFASGNYGFLLTLLFLVPFIGVGFFLMRAHLFSAHADHLIEVTAKELRLTRRLFGRLTKPKSLPLENLRSIAVEVTMHQNDKPIYALVARAGKKKIQFGASLAMNERRWLAAELLQACGMLPEATKAGVESGEKGTEVGAKTTRSLSSLENFESEKLRIKGTGDQSFRAAWKVSGGLPVALCGLIFSGVGAFLVYELPWRQSGLDLLFYGMPTLMALIFSTVGLMALFWGIRQLGLRIDLEFHEGGIYWRRFLYGSEKRESFVREQIGEVKRRQSGNAGAQIKYAVTLKIEGKRRTLLHWSGEDESARLTEWISLWLSVTDKNKPSI